MPKNVAIKDVGNEECFVFLIPGYFAKVGRASSKVGESLTENWEILGRVKINSHFEAMQAVGRIEQGVVATTLEPDISTRVNILIPNNGFPVAVISQEDVKELQRFCGI